MKTQKVTYCKNEDDSTLTLKILVGETYEDTIVTEKISLDEESGEEYAHFIMETPTTEDQVLRTLEELAAEHSGEFELVEDE